MTKYFWEVVIYTDTIRMYVNRESVHQNSNFKYYCWSVTKHILNVSVPFYNYPKYSTFSIFCKALWLLGVSEFRTPNGVIGCINGITP